MTSTNINLNEPHTPREGLGARSDIQAILENDPSGHFSNMDADTKSAYLNQVLKLASSLGVSAVDVADSAIASSRKAQSPDAVEAHVGYFLFRRSLDDSRQASASKTRAVTGRLRTAARNHALFVYMTGLIATAICLAAVCMQSQPGPKIADWSATTYISLLVLLSAIFLQTTTAIAKLAYSTVAVAPKPFRMDYEHVKQNARETLVVIPIILDAENWAAALASIENHYVANPEQNIRFCILTDFADANFEIMPGENRALSEAYRDVDQLNKKYTFNLDGKFLLLHRKRAWDVHNKVWTGLERKRGKISDLNNLIIYGNNASTFDRLPRSGSLAEVRYVFTVDLDSIIPSGSVKKLVQTIEHPLNEPKNSPSTKKITGYNILQPRVLSRRPQGRVTLFECWQRGSCYNDGHHLAPIQADLVQQAFRQGMYFGKGLYEVRSFQSATHGEIPSNLILSHDHVEGSFNSILWVPDVSILESLPSSDREDAKRNHRWMRGDWQNILWLLRTCGGRSVNLVGGIPWLWRQRLAENVLRNITPVLIVAAVWIACLNLVSPSRWLWSICLITALPLLAERLMSVVRVARRPSRMALSMYANVSVIKLSGFIYELSKLPLAAVASIDAILRSSWRVCVSHKNVLQWSPFDGQKQHTRASELMSAAKALIVNMGLLALILTTTHASLHTFVELAPYSIAWTLAPLGIPLGGMVKVNVQNIKTQRYGCIPKAAAAKKDMIADGTDFKPL